ncbi:MAG: hypothetical protein AB1508_00655 [Pseudomonadota bacterium]
MAEYYPLLAKAVAGLPNSTPETRRAVYERARKALLGQLQNLQPPVPAADLARETEALDAAVARLEAELAGKTPSASPAPQPRPTPSPTSRPAAPPVRPAPPQRPAAPSPKIPATPSWQTGAAPVAPQAGPQVTPQVGPPAGARRANGAAALDDKNGAPNGGAPAGRARENGVQPPPVSFGPAAPPMETPLPPREATRESIRESTRESTRGEPRLEPRVEPRIRPSEPVRPIAPQPDLEDGPLGRRLWLVIGVVVVLVALVAVAAWKLRDHPDQLTAFNKPPEQTAADKNAGKNTQRVGGPESAPVAQESSAPGAAPAAMPSPSAAPAAAPATAPAAASKPADSNATVPVAYRAALLVEAPEEQNKVKTYVGTVIWKLQNVSNGPGQPLATAVHADIDVPDDKLKVSIDIQKNTDPSLSASHTMTVVFAVGPDSSTGGVKEISLPQMRGEDSPSGEALKGIVVPIMDNSFLIGLSRGDAEGGNTDLLKKLAWIDIPIMLNNGRIAKLTFEKNTSGSRAIDDAFASWQAQQ